MKNKTVTIVDPPEGWRFGFPRQMPNSIDQNDPKQIRAWMLDCGYPEKIMLGYGEYFHYRVWQEEIK